ncbi:MAG: hypothetical protein KAI70_07800 [Candidatus Omnitrophica bacterium]|nr:hypothetical protein [Candidatus Omnitrophota bacterium]
MFDNKNSQKKDISFSETLSNISADNLARIKHLGQKPTFVNKFFSYLWPTMTATIFYRLSHYFYRKNLEIMSFVFFELNVIFFGCDIDACSEIGKGFVLVHVGGTAVRAKIGENVIVFGQAAIGSNGTGSFDEGWFGGPEIGDKCIIGFRAMILGPISLGSNVFVKAGTLVTKSVPDNSTVGGVPARIAERK